MGQRAWRRGHGAEGRAQSVTAVDEEGGGMMVKFRFQDLKIWQLAIEIADELFDIADELEKKKLL
jgi:hypothetical protein